MKMNILPAFRFRFRESLKVVGTFYLVMILITAALTIGYISFYVSSEDGSISGSFSAFAMASSCALFVTGICSVREDLRLCIQHGVSRITSFVSGLLAALLSCIILAASGELLTAVAQAVTADYENYFVSDLYQMLYADGKFASLSLGGHIVSIVFNFSMMASAYMAGMFISMVFYRLNKAWTIVVAVGAPVFVFAVLPILMQAAGSESFVSRMLAGLVDWILSSPWAWISFFIIGAVVLIILDWLLMRRAPIKAAQK